MSIASYFLSYRTLATDLYLLITEIPVFPLVAFILRNLRLKGNKKPPLEAVLPCCGDHRNLESIISTLEFVAILLFLLGDTVLQQS